ncbi:MAG: FAD/NAD(P)-binding protein [Nocardioides sp.]|uniref:FAD/NAD(P)-binding protein n=1 Tax=Nocardioides sp. TaxID=35761 RepID=UPI003EFE5415
MGEHARGGAYDLAVVGAGPRALSALLALDDQLPERVARPLAVLLLDPAPPGAGAVWDPAQSPHLLMNVNADIVDLRSRTVPWTWREWARATRTVEDPDDPYPPRARVGDHLVWAYERLCTSPRLDLRHVPDVVRRVRRTEAAWELETDRAPGVPWTASDVLLCTGHLDGGGVDHSAVVRHAPGPGRELVVRGAALSGFDVVLDVTAGRGGRWVRDNAVPSGLRYVRSGAEPDVVRLLSRGGELMLPKPTEVDPGVGAVVRAETVRLRELDDPDERWWQVLADATLAAAAASGHSVEPGQLGTVLEDGRAPQDPWLRWTDDLRRADGHTDPDAAWWWGRAWSAGYPDVVASLERAPRTSSWALFRRRAARLERWAFGPPPVTVRRLLAVHEAGLLEVERDRGGPADVVAVTAPPGVVDGDRREAPDPMWAGLLQDGWVSVRDFERGVWTTPRGQCVGATGSVTPGLWVLGRPTEDPVIGHDTLSGTLHGDVARWARTFAARAGAGPRLQTAGGVA